MGFSDKDVTIERKGKEITIAKSSVYRVATLGTKRGRNALIGLAVGAGLGVAFGACCAGDAGTEAVVAGSAGLFGAVGAGIGAALPAGDRTVYKDEHRKEGRQ